MKRTHAFYAAALLVLGVMSAPCQLSHPFLLFNSSDTAVIAARVRSDPNHAALFSEVLQEANYYRYSSTWPSSGDKNKGEWYENLPSLAFAYLMTHEAVYADRARYWLFNENPNPWNQGIIHDSWPEGDRPIFRRIIALSFVYDWMYEQLSEAERAQIRNRIIADLNFDNPDPDKRYKGPRTFFDRPNIAIESNWIANAAEALLLGAMVVYGEDQSYSTVQAEADIRLAANHAFLGESSWLGRAFSPVDGSYVEGVSYALWEGSRLPVMIRALSRWDATNYYQQTGIRDRLSRLFDWLAYEVLPGQKTPGRMFNNFNAAYKQHRGALTTALTLSGEYPEKGGVMKWVFDNTMQNITNLLPGTGGEDLQAIHGNALFFVLPILEYTGTTAVDPGTVLPSSRNFPWVGLSYIRTSVPPLRSWADDEDIQFAITCQPAYDPRTGRFIIRHDQADKNSFTLSAYGCDFIEPLGYSDEGTWPSGANYIMMDVDGVFKGQAIASWFNDEGIERPNWFLRSGRIVSHHASDTYAFVHGDAKEAFSKLHREINGVVTVIDDPGDPDFFGPPHSPDKSYLNPVLRADRFVLSQRGVNGTLQYFVVADDIKKDDTPRVYHWLYHSPYWPTGTNPITLRDEIKGAELLLWESHANYTSEATVQTLSVTESVLDAGAPYFSVAQPISTTSLQFISGPTVDPYFHVILLPKRTSTTAPAMTRVATSNGSCFQFDWPEYRDYSVFCYSGVASSTVFSTDGRLTSIRKNLTTGLPLTYAMAEGTTLWFENRQLVDLQGAVGTVLKDEDVVRIFGPITNYSIYSPVTTTVFLNDVSVDFTQNGEYVEPSILSFALLNMSISDGATSANNQRKLLRESSGTLHEVFESGGEVFYRRSTDGGTSWHVTTQLSDGLTGNVKPCFSFAGTTALCVWNRPDEEDRQEVFCARSTDGGITWPPATVIESGPRCHEPGPLMSVSLYPGGSGIVLYRTTGGLKYRLTSNFGASWGSASNVPGSTASCNMPSSAINTTYWSAKQANIAYATDLPEGSPHIYCNFYDFSAGTWGAATDLCSVLPAEYVHHANPSLAVSASEAYKAVHVAWDAEHTLLGARVLIHREGGFRYFPSVYSALQYESETNPSITGVSGEAAWMVYQSASGTSVWKRYYDGTYWPGWDGTWVASGRDPQISVGSSNAKYIWTEGSQPPYEIRVSTEGLSKAGDMLAYSRALNVIDTATGRSLSLEIGTPIVVYSNGRREEIPFAESVVDSFLTDIAGLLKMGQSSPFAVPSDAESLSVPIRISGIGQGTLLSGGTGNVMLIVVEPARGKVLKVLTDAVVTESSVRTEATLTVPAKDLGDAAGNSLLQIRPDMSGIKTGAGTILSLGHMYRKVGGAGVAKGGEVVKQQPDIPTRFLLHQNYPNPFNPSTRFSFEIAEGGHVSLTIHDVLGREVAKVVEGHREPGRYTVEWNAGSGATTLSSGVYLARLRVKSAMGKVLYSQTTKIIAIK